MILPLLQSEASPTVVHVRGIPKVAVTVVAAVTDTVQVVGEVVVLLQLADQPMKVELPAGAAVRVTLVPESKGAEHVVPQLIPPESDVTVPLPFPDLLTVNVNVFSVNVAVTDFAAVIDTVQVPVVFVQAPDHPAKVDPVAGVAVRMTLLVP